MKLSQTTIEVLRNFADINPNLSVQPGTLLRTISTNKVVYAKATVPDSFPKAFAVYGLGKLLSVLSMHEGVDLVFTDTSIEFVGVGGRSKTHVRYADPALVVKPPDKEINISQYEVQFKLTKDDLAWVSKIGSVLGCPYVVISNNAGRVIVSAQDVKGEIVDDSTLDVGDLGGTGVPFKFAIKCENLKLLPGDYEVSLAAKGVARFVGKPTTYFVAIEQSSSYYGESKGD